MFLASINSSKAGVEPLVHHMFPGRSCQLIRSALSSPPWEAPASGQGNFLVGRSTRRSDTLARRGDPPSDFETCALIRRGKRKESERRRKTREEREDTYFFEGV